MPSRNGPLGQGSGRWEPEPTPERKARERRDLRSDFGSQRRRVEESASAGKFPENAPVGPGFSGTADGTVISWASPA